MTRAPLCSLSTAMPKRSARLPPDSDRWAAHLSDVSIKGGSEPLIAACVARFGQLDILANIAGVGNSKPAHLDV